MKIAAHFALLVARTIVLLSAILFLPRVVFAQNQYQNPAVALSSSEVTGGNVILLRIDTGDLNLHAGDMRIDFNTRTYRVYQHPLKGDGAYFALVGIPYRTIPGANKLSLKYSDPAGYQTRQIPFDVVGSQVKTDILQVDPKLVDPNKKDRKRAEREHQEVKHIYAGGNLKRLWEGPFQLPVENRISSPFGNRREFNGKLKNYHNGLDFRSPKGIPVYAANSGIVRVAKNLFYSGNAVIIDHGTEIFTIYAHLSKIKATVGQLVEKGQLIGLSGATGRVSGPHLHWGVKVNGIAVNPLQFVKVMDKLTHP